MQYNERENTEDIDVNTVAYLTEDELAEFVGVQSDEQAVKMVMDAATKSARGIAREIIDRRNDFWLKLMESRSLPPNGQYMIDTRSGAVMVPKRETQ